MLKIGKCPEKGYYLILESCWSCLYLRHDGRFGTIVEYFENKNTMISALINHSKIKELIELLNFDKLDQRITHKPQFIFGDFL